MKFFSVMSILLPLAGMYYCFYVFFNKIFWAVLVSTFQKINPTISEKRGIYGENYGMHYAINGSMRLGLNDFFVLIIALVLKHSIHSRV